MDRSMYSPVEERFIQLSSEGKQLGVRNRDGVLIIEISRLDLVSQSHSS